MFREWTECLTSFDVIGPLGPEKIRERKPHQEVAQRRRVEDTGIVNNREVRHVVRKLFIAQV